MLDSICRRDRHGPIKAGVTFEQPATHACPDCLAKDAVILALSDKLECLARHLGRLAERKARQDEPFMPPD